MTSKARQFPEQTDRVESGPIAFGQDWPGVFLRGDEALPMAMYLGVLLNAVEHYNEQHVDNPLIDEYSLLALRGLHETLGSCHVNVCEPKDK